MGETVIGYLELSNTFRRKNLLLSGLGCGFVCLTLGNGCTDSNDAFLICSVHVLESHKVLAVDTWVLYANKMLNALFS